MWLGVLVLPPTCKMVGFCNVWQSCECSRALQVVTDEMWEARALRFPEHTPSTREYYLLRSIFEEQFPSQQALATVPKASLRLPVMCNNVKASQST
jgi:hypothetical protein